MINDIEIRNEGYIDPIKHSNNIRIMSLNVKGLDPWKYEKIERFIESSNQNQIDIMMVSEVNVKWNPVNLDRMEQQMKRLGREATVYAADSLSWASTLNNYLPGGIISIPRKSKITNK